MKRKKNKFDLVKSWLEKARRDLAVAIEQIKKEKPFSDIICFHAQQAVEKLLKGYLAFYGIEFPKTHVIEDLLDLCLQKEDSFASLQTARKLTRYAIQTRYPEFEEPSVDDAKEAIEIAREVAEFIKQKLPKKCIPKNWDL